MRSRVGKDGVEDGGSGQGYSMLFMTLSGVQSLSKAQGEDSGRF